MKHKVTKIFFSHEQEEKWLNKMASYGLMFVNYTFCRYTFEEGTPGEYIYRIELLKNFPTNLESKAYIKFMEESGVDCIDTYGRWAFFRRKSIEGPFELFTDSDSRIEHHKRILTFTGIIGFLNLLYATNSLNLASKENLVESLFFYIALLNLIVAGILLTISFKNWRKVRKIRKEKKLFDK